jgi:hypothetical protein
MQAIGQEITLICSFCQELSPGPRRAASGRDQGLGEPLEYTS